MLLGEGGGGFAVHVHLGLSSRPELFSVEEGDVGGGSKLEGRRVRSGWLATCPDDMSRFVCVFSMCFSVSGERWWGGQCLRGRCGGCVLG